MMSRLAAKHSNEKRLFKAQIYKSRGSHPQSQNRSYNQRGYQNRSRRSDSRNRGEYGNNRSRQIFRDNIFERTLEDMEYKIVEESIGIIGAIIVIEAGIDQEKGHSKGTMAIIGTEVLEIVDQDQGLELVLIEIG